MSPTNARSVDRTGQTSKHTYLAVCFIPYVHVTLDQLDTVDDTGKNLVFVHRMWLIRWRWKMIGPKGVDHTTYVALASVLVHPCCPRLLCSGMLLRKATENVCWPKNVPDVWRSPTKCPYYVSYRMEEILLSELFQELRRKKAGHSRYTHTATAVIM